MAIHRMREDGAVSDDRPPDTPPDVDEATRRLWGQEATRRRGPRPALNVHAIVEAALELADAEGLAAVSMARVGDALHCSAMALYRHISSKDELLTLLVDRVAADAPALPDDLGWREGLAAWTRIQIDGVLAHPWLLELPLASTPLGPHRTRWIDQGFGAMRRLGLPTEEKGQILSLLSQHVLAEARVQVEIRHLATSPYADLAQVIEQLADAEDLPHLFAAFADGSTGDGAEAFGIDLILDGVEARLRRRRRQRRL
jgi:AcrR family transcriptional regulator